jgi:hypothetical protein
VKQFTTVAPDELNLKENVMKKIHLAFVAISFIAIAPILVFTTTKAVSQKKSTQTITSIPENVSTILKNSCAQCHNNGGNPMASAHWNYAELDKYPAAKLAKKANAMCNAITKGIMPPESVRKNSPDRVPTAEQADIICKWASSLQVK